MWPACCRGDISYIHVEHQGNTVLQPDGSAQEGEKQRKSSFSSPQHWTELAVVQGWDKWKYIRVEDEIILVWIWLGSLRKCWRWGYWQSSHLSYRRLAEQTAERSQKSSKYGQFFMGFFSELEKEKEELCVSVCCRTTSHSLNTLGSFKSNCLCAINHSDGLIIITLAIKNSPTFNICNSTYLGIFNQLVKLPT